jgi:hypothetical protein
MFLSLQMCVECDPGGTERAAAEMGQRRELILFRPAE